MALIVLQQGNQVAVTTFEIGNLALRQGLEK